MNTKVRYFLRSLLPVACFLFLQNAMAVFGVQVLLVLDALRYRGETYMGFLQEVFSHIGTGDFIQWVSLGSSLVGALLFGLWFSRLQKALGALSGSGAELKRPTVSARLVLLMGIFAMGAQYISCYLILVLGLAFPEWADQYQKLQELSGITPDGLTPILLINGILLAPVCEELCIRGVTYTYAKLAMPRRSANIVQALLFAGLHGNPIQGIYTFLMGLAFGELYERSGRISYSILLHILFNAMGLLMNRYIFIGSRPLSFFVTLFTSMTCAYVSFGWLLGEADKLSGQS